MAIQLLQELLRRFRQHALEPAHGHDHAWRLARAQTRHDAKRRLELAHDCPEAYLLGWLRQSRAAGLAADGLDVAEGGELAHDLEQVVHGDAVCVAELADGE